MAYSMIRHNNVELLFFNHRGLSGDELLNSFREATRFVIQNKKPVRTVCDFTDTTVSKELNEYLNSDEMKESAKYVIKQAVTGISGIKKMILRLYNTFTGTKSKLFDTLDEAKDYAASD